MVSRDCDFVEAVEYFHSFVEANGFALTYPSLSAVGARFLMRPPAIAGQPNLRTVKSRPLRTNIFGRGTCHNDRLGSGSRFQVGLPFTR